MKTNKNNTCSMRVLCKPHPSQLPKQPRMPPLLRSDVGAKQWLLLIYPFADSWLPAVPLAGQGLGEWGCYRCLGRTDGQLNLLMLGSFLGVKEDILGYAALELLGCVTNVSLQVPQWLILFGPNHGLRVFGFVVGPRHKGSGIKSLKPKYNWGMKSLPKWCAW